MSTYDLKILITWNTQEFYAFTGKEMLDNEKGQPCPELFQMFEALNERWKTTRDQVNSKWNIADPCHDNFKKFDSKELQQRFT